MDLLEDRLNRVEGQQHRRPQQWEGYQTQSKSQSASSSSGGQLWPPLDVQNDLHLKNVVEDYGSLQERLTNLEQKLAGISSELQGAPGGVACERRGGRGKSSHSVAALTDIMGDVEVKRYKTSQDGKIEWSLDGGKTW